MDKLIVGCGYLGRRVAARWSAQGHRVFATTRSESRAEGLRRLGVEPVVCDVLDPGSLRALPTAATVLYCVGFDRTAGRTLREVYVGGLGNVVAALPRSVEKFLHVSSTGVYGQAEGEEVDETAATEPAEESGRVVLDAERVARSLGDRAVVLRFAGIYGPGRLIRRQAVEAGEPLAGDPEKWLNLIHVEDGADAVVAAEARARPGRVYNVCDDRPVRRGEFFAALARLLGAPGPTFVPGPAERGNRRVVNWRLREELSVALRYPSYQQGLPASLAEERGP